MLLVPFVEEIVVGFRGTEKKFVANEDWKDDLVVYIFSLDHLYCLL